MCSRVGEESYKDNFLLSIKPCLGGRRGLRGTFRGGVSVSATPRGHCWGVGERGCSWPVGAVGGAGARTFGTPEARPRLARGQWDPGWRRGRALVLGVGDG